MKHSQGFSKATAINISTNTNVTPPSRGLSCTVAGVVNVTMAEDGTVLLVPLSAGNIQDLQVKAISNVGSTATGVVVYK